MRSVEYRDEDPRGRCLARGRLCVAAAVGAQDVLRARIAADDAAAVADAAAAPALVQALSVCEEGDEWVLASASRPAAAVQLGAALEALRAGDLEITVAGVALDDVHTRVILTNDSTVVFVRHAPLLVG